MRVLWLILASLAFFTSLEAAARNDKPSGISPPLPCATLDLVIAIDQTNSIGLELFDKMLNFTQDLVDRFFVSFTKTRLGLVTFGRSASDIGSNLKKWKSGRQHLTEKRIRRIPHILDNVTNLEEGLQMAFDKFIEKKKKRKNRLTDVPKVVIIFTDGKTNKEARLKSLIKHTNVTVIAVGLGPKLNPRVLNEIADKVVYWKKEMSEKVVLKRIMANFNFQPCEENIPSHPDIKKFGCYSKTYVDQRNNKTHDALYSFESDKCWLIDDDGSKNRTDAFEKCAWLAWKRGYNTFGLDSNNTCQTGFVARRFYKGGLRSNCQEKAGGIDSNVVYYFQSIAPRVSYGTISCLKVSVPAMAVIPKEKVDRMPAADGTITERCAWAARTQNDVVYALKSGATPECFSSNNTVSAVLDPDNQMACTGSQGERELFFTGTCVACIVVGASRDIAILVDVDEKNIPFVVTLVDTLQVTDDKNHVGVVATKTSNAIHVAFSSPDSRNETLLLPKIRSAAKNVGFYSRSGEYRDSLLRVKELFTNQANGARDDVRKTLLFVTDRPKELIQGSSSLLNEVINLKKLMGDKSRIVAVGFSDDITSIPPDKLQSFAAYVDGVFGIDTTDRVTAAEQYYRKKLNEILQQMC